MQFLLPDSRPQTPSARPLTPNTLASGLGRLLSTSPPEGRGVLHSRAAAFSTQLSLAESLLEEPSASADGASPTATPASQQEVDILLLSEDGAPESARKSLAQLEEVRGAGEPKPPAGQASFIHASQGYLYFLALQVFLLLLMSSSWLYLLHLYAQYWAGLWQHPVIHWSILSLEL